MKIITIFWLTVKLHSRIPYYCVPLRGNPWGLYTFVLRDKEWGAFMSTYQAKYRSGYFTFLPVRWAIGDPNARVSLPRLTEHPKQLWRTIDKIPTGSRVRSGVCFPNRMMKTVRVVGCLLDTDHRIDPFMWDINGNKLLHSKESVNMRLCLVIPL